MTVDELEQIADLAKRQREGGFTTEADAMFALDLIERLARAVRSMEQEAINRSLGG